MPLRKQFPYAVALIVATATALALVGCSQNPYVQWHQARRTVSHVERHIRQQTEAGVVSEDAALLSEPAVKAMRAAVDDARNRLAEGDDRGFRADMRLFAAILLRLSEDYFIPPLPPTTQPAEKP
jgi:hypothetical protein